MVLPADSGRYAEVKAIPHNSKRRYGARGAAAAKPKAQIILDAAKVSAASGGYSEPKQGQRSQSARGFCPEARCGYRNPTLSSILATQMPRRTPSRSEALRSATAACGGSWRGDPPERCLSRQAGIVRYCLKALGRADTEFVPTKKAVPSAWKALLFLYALASSARLRLRRYSRAAVRMASDDTSVMSQFSVKPAIR